LTLVAAGHETEDRSFSTGSAARNSHESPEPAPDGRASGGDGASTSAYDPAAYGEAVAGDYDALYGAIPDTDDAVALLAELARDGPLLELGVGTGRLALPLVARGIDVHGVEASAAMIAELARKPGGEHIPVVQSSFDDYRIDQSFTCVVLALHTIYGLPSHDRQVRCFATAAEHLRPGGVFVVEGNLVDPADFRNGRAVMPRFRSAERVELQVMEYDVVSQRMEVTNVHLSSEGGVRLNSFTNQYSSPREMDLMARLGGLRLRKRFGGWSLEPFTAASAKHVSVYELER